LPAEVRRRKRRGRGSIEEKESGEGIARKTTGGKSFKAQRELKMSARQEVRKSKRRSLSITGRTLDILRGLIVQQILGKNY